MLISFFFFLLFVLLLLLSLHRALTLTLTLRCQEDKDETSPTSFLPSFSPFNKMAAAKGKGGKATVMVSPVQYRIWFFLFPFILTLLLLLSQVWNLSFIFSHSPPPPILAYLLLLFLLLKKMDDVVHYSVVRLGRCWKGSSSSLYTPTRLHHITGTTTNCWPRSSRLHTSSHNVVVVALLDSRFFFFFFTIIWCSIDYWWEHAKKRTGHSFRPDYYYRIPFLFFLNRSLQLNMKFAFLIVL